MKLLGKTAIRSLLSLSLLAPTITFAAPIVYDITTASSGGYAFSFLNGADGAQHGDGYFFSGTDISLSGSLTLDWANPGTASGTISGNGDFGPGDGLWELNITGGTVADGTVFAGDTSDTIVSLLSLSYTLDYNGGLAYSGTFQFADRTFGGGLANSGSLDAPEIYLLGNNFVNEFGDSGDKEFAGDGQALAIGLYGVSSVPEPASLFMLGTGLLGLALRRRRKVA